MQKKTVLVLTVQEAKEAMVKHYTDFLVSNPTHLSTLIRDGKLDELPNFATVTPSQVTQMYRDNAVGADVAQRESVDAVFVQAGNTLETVYEKPAPPPVQAQKIEPQEQHYHQAVS
jgi:hypothetical protein